MKKAVLLLLISLVCTFGVVKGLTAPFQGDLVSELSERFKHGNAKRISKYFSSTVNLSLLNNENVYSSAQSEIILDNFFRSNPPQSVKVVHRLDNHANYQHVVLLLGTAKGAYRVALSLKGLDKELQLIEIRIEEAN